MKTHFTILVFSMLGFFASVSLCQAQTGNAFDSLNVNNIGARISNLGDNFVNLSNNSSAFEAPINTNMHTIYVSALWIGGYQNKNLKIAAMTYRQNGVDFFPGPLDTNTATTNTARMAQWNQLYTVRKTEIQNFLTDSTIYASIANWPGNRDTATNESTIQAPYVDVNGDHKYNPLDGDYPDMKGDEMIWWAMNDNGGTHGETKGNAIGIDVQGEAYAFTDTASEAIKNTIFVDYKFTNRSSQDLDSAYIGLYTDFDIGYAFDDYIGSAPKLSAFFGYNGKPVDPVYGANPPIESVIFLKDSLSRFIAYNNTADPINGNPGFPNPNPMDYYNFLAGRWKNGDCIKYGQDGIKGTQCTGYMYDGDPSDSVTGWTEHNAGNTPGDRRGLGSIGPLTIKAGETHDVPVAYVFVRKGNLANDYQTSMQYWREVREYYNTNFTTSGVQNIANPASAIKLFPNPATNKVYVSSGNLLINKIVLVDNMGRQIYTANGNGFGNQTSIDISHLSDGMYTVLCETKTGVTAQKLIIAR